MPWPLHIKFKEKDIRSNTYVLSYFTRSIQRLIP